MLTTLATSLRIHGESNVRTVEGLYEPDAERITAYLERSDLFFAENDIVGEKKVPVDSEHSSSVQTLIIIMVQVYRLKQRYNKEHCYMAWNNSRTGNPQHSASDMIYHYITE